MDKSHREQTPEEIKISMIAKELEAVRQHKLSSEDLIFAQVSAILLAGAFIIFQMLPSDSGPLAVVPLAFFLFSLMLALKGYEKGNKYEYETGKTSKQKTFSGLIFIAMMAMLATFLLGFIPR